MTCQSLAALSIAAFIWTVVATPVSADVFYEIVRIDDNTVSISGSGTIDAAVQGVQQLHFPFASTQTNDSDLTLTGDLAFAGVPFASGGPANTDSIYLGFAFGNSFDFMIGDGPEGMGGFSTTLDDFTVSPVGTTGQVLALSSGLNFQAIGSYAIVAIPEPSSMVLLGLGSAALLLRRQQCRSPQDVSR
jgi:hypothetical protein